MSGLLLPSLLEWDEHEFDGFGFAAVCAGVVVGARVGLDDLEFNCFWGVSSSYVYVSWGGGVVNVFVAGIYMFNGVEN
jgi:hypothetical protein